jgi:aerobic carbon-monoxide dehydrogenase medium subunit
VIPAQLDYTAPTSLADAVSQLAGATNARVLAGGQGLVPDLTTRRMTAGLLVDLRNVPDLGSITATDGGGVRAGAMVTLDDLAASDAVRGAKTALSDALRSFGDPQVRNRATVGGALAHAHHGVDLPAVAVAMNASVTVFGAGGERTVAADALYGPSGALGPADVITSADWPGAAPGSGSAYEKVRNPASSYAICGAAVTVTLAADGTIDSARIAMAGGANAATRLPKVEAALAGQPPTDATFARVAHQLSEEGLSFPSDLAAPAEYRAHLAEVLITRSLATAADRAKEARP